MLQLGKMQIFEHEMDRKRMDICGLSEIRWEGQGHFHTLGGHTVMFCGNNKRGLHDVATWVNKKIAQAIINYETLNERKTQEHHTDPSVCTNNSR